MPNILIVDDDDDLGGWISGILTGAGYAVEELPGAVGVLRLLSLGLVDVALIDYHLGGTTGLKLLHDIRAANNSTPVVMLTSDSSQQLAVQCFRAGAADFVTKPVDPDYLKIIVERTLANHARSLLNTAYRALAYTRHKDDCSFHTDAQSCDCGLKDIYADIQEFKV